MLLCTAPHRYQHDGCELTQRQRGADQAQLVQPAAQRPDAPGQQLVHLLQRPRPQQHEHQALHSDQLAHHAPASSQQLQHQACLCYLGACKVQALRAVQVWRCRDSLMWLMNRLSISLLTWQPVKLSWDEPRTTKQVGVAARPGAASAACSPARGRRQAAGRPACSCTPQW